MTAQQATQHDTAQQTAERHDAACQNTASEQAQHCEAAHQQSTLHHTTLSDFSCALASSAPTPGGGGAAALAGALGSNLVEMVGNPVSYTHLRAHET